jgi:hypothetical protein
VTRITCFIAALATSGCAAEGTATLGDGQVVSESQAYTLSLEPAAPLRRGQNQLRILTALPEGTRIRAASAFMPAHSHGSATGTVREQRGETLIENLELTMPGRWEITLDVDGARGPDAARFALEVP